MSEENQDAKFLTDIISQICNYAVDNNMEPDDTVRTVANNLLQLLAVSTFNGWKGGEE